MATLYLSQQGATLRKEQNRFVVEHDGKILAEAHDFKVERVVVFGHAQLSTQAMAFLLERGIDTAFLSAHGRLKGRLAPIESKNSPLRIAQYARSLDPSFALNVARAMVAGKIANCSEVLARHCRNHPASSLQNHIDQLAAAGQKARRARPVESLRGIEGTAAAIYFQGFARCLRRNFDFHKRTRRPPADPVNSLLSFAYTLLYNEAIAAAAAAGFDCYIGFFHSIHYGRCSLALDLMEEFRPLIADRLALNLVNLDVIKADDFHKQSREQGDTETRRHGDAGTRRQGFYLNDDARKRFLREYERMTTAEFAHKQTGVRTSLRRALHHQALVLQKTVLNGGPYRPFDGWR
jgi:CRISPR-associated protein Cas1